MIRIWIQEIVRRVRGEGWETKQTYIFEALKEMQEADSKIALQYQIDIFLVQLREQLNLPELAQYFEENWFNPEWEFAWVYLFCPFR